MPFIKRSPGRIPEILEALTLCEKTIILGRIRILFYLAVFAIVLSSLPWIYIGVSGRISSHFMVASFGVSVFLWLAAHLLIRSAKNLLCTSQYAIIQSITAPDIRRACFSGRMLAGTKNPAEQATSSNGDRPSN